MKTCASVSRCTGAQAPSFEHLSISSAAPVGMCSRNGETAVATVPTMRPSAGTQANAPGASGGDASEPLVDDRNKEFAGNRSFPGWEPFLPHLVHPLKVTIVEALLWIGEPLSAVQFGKVFRGA